MIRYFGSRVSQCLFRLFKDAEGKTDKDRWIDYLVHERNWTREKIESLPRAYWRKRCRYVRPAPEDIITSPSLITTINFFSTVIDPETGHQFFGAGWRKQFRTAISYVQKGYLSDSPHMSMYSKVKLISAKYNVWQYRCCRGTSALEGYHLHYRAFFHSSALNVGPRLHELLKTSFDFRWNVTRGRHLQLFISYFMMK